MEQQVDNNTVNLSFNNDDPAAQSVILESDKSKLPKLTVPRGERFYIGLEELNEVNAKYFAAVSDMREGTEYAPAELKSKMESGIDLAYNEDIARLREKNRLESEVERERIETLNSILMPRSWRGWFFRKKRNQAQMLLDELVERQAATYLQRKSDELPPYPGAELQPFEVVLETLKERLPRMRKKRRAKVSELIEQLAYGYNSKLDELKRLAAELEEAKKTIAAMTERALRAEELLDEFLKESSPVPDEAEEHPEEQKESEAKETDEDPPKEKTESDSADEEDDDGLSYDGLDEAYDSE